jgi:predicted TIM-barrel fold metal-dependent hydrolase
VTDGPPVFDADAHIIEPPGLYFEYLDPAFRHRVEPDPNLGERHGRLMPLLDGRPSYGGPPWMHEVLRSDQGYTILVERFGSLAERNFNPEAMIEALDMQGVARAALFPSYSLHVPFTAHAEPDLADALARAYNRWIGEYCSHAPDRLVGMAVAPLHDPERAAAEVKRAVIEHGARGVMVRPNPIDGRSLTDADHDGFFSLIEDLDVALLVHEGRGGVAEFAGDRFDTWYASHAVSHPFEMMLAFTGFSVDGVFDRHPGLRVGLLEAGTGWLRWWLNRLDEHHALFAAHERSDMGRSPSDYFNEHCVVGSDTDDHFVRETVETVGADHVAWSSDFPHMEARFPDGVDVFLSHATLTEQQTHEVLWETPCRLYGLDPSEVPTT